MHGFRARRWKGKCSGLRSIRMTRLSGLPLPAALREAAFGGQARAQQGPPVVPIYKLMTPTALPTRMLGEGR